MRECAPRGAIARARGVKQLKECREVVHGASLTAALPSKVRPVSLRALLCVPLGHQWSEAPELVETYPVLRCRRCGKLQNMSSETRGVTPWTARRGSPTGRMSGGVGRDGRPY